MSFFHFWEQVPCKCRPHWVFGSMDLFQPVQPLQYAQTPFVLFNTVSFEISLIPLPLETTVSEVILRLLCTSLTQKNSLSSSLWYSVRTEFWGQPGSSYLKCYYSNSHTVIYCTHQNGISSHLTSYPLAFDMSSLKERVCLLQISSNSLAPEEAAIWILMYSSPRREHTAKNHNPKAAVQGRPPWTIITLTSLISSSLENMIKKWPGHTAAAPWIWLVPAAACQSSWEVQMCPKSRPPPAN